MTKVNKLSNLSKSANMVDIAAALKHQMDNIVDNSNAPWKTNRKFVDTILGTKDLDQITDVYEIQALTALMINRKKSWDEAQQVLELRTTKVYAANGYSFEDWVHDFKLRIEIITQKEKIEKLRALYDEASSLMTAEDRRSQFLDKLKSLNS